MHTCHHILQYQQKLDAWKPDWQVLLTCAVDELCTSHANWCWMLFWGFVCYQKKIYLNQNFESWEMIYSMIYVLFFVLIQSQHWLGCIVLCRRYAVDDSFMWLIWCHHHDISYLLVQLMIVVHLVYNFMWPKTVVIENPNAFVMHNWAILMATFCSHSHITSCVCWMSCRDYPAERCQIC